MMLHKVVVNPADGSNHLSYWFTDEPVSTTSGDVVTYTGTKAELAINRAGKVVDATPGPQMTVSIVLRNVVTWYREPCVIQNPEHN